MPNVYPNKPRTLGKRVTHANPISISYRYRGSVVRTQTQKKIKAVAEIKKVKEVGVCTINT